LCHFESLRLLRHIVFGRDTYFSPRYVSKNDLLTYRLAVASSSFRFPRPFVFLCVRRETSCSSSTMRHAGIRGGGAITYHIHLCAFGLLVLVVSVTRLNNRNTVRCNQHRLAANRKLIYLRTVYTNTAVGPSCARHTHTHTYMHTSVTH